VLATVVKKYWPEAMLFQLFSSVEVLTLLVLFVLSIHPVLDTTCC